MRVIQKLKFYVKEAIQSGKVVCKSDKSRIVLTGPTPFKDFISRLDPEEWNRFEAAERAFRQTISSGNIYEEKFICTGDLGKWRRFDFVFWNSPPFMNIPESILIILLHFPKPSLHMNFSS